MDHLHLLGTLSNAAFNHKIQCADAAVQLTSATNTRYSAEEHPLKTDSRLWRKAKEATWSSRHQTLVVYGRNKTFREVQVRSKTSMNVRELTMAWVTASMLTAAPIQ